MIFKPTRLKLVSIISFFLCLLFVVVLFVYPLRKKIKPKKVRFNYESIKTALAQMGPDVLHILNNTEKAETEKLVFNRIEKVGSTSMLEIINILSHSNNFEPYIGFTLPYQFYFEDEIANAINGVNGAISITEHMNWINFTRYNIPKPIYMNLIRYPIDKVISAYYYIRTPEVYNYYIAKFGWPKREKKYFEMSFNDCVREAILDECIFDNHIGPFRDWRSFAMRLCGYDPVCNNFNSQAVARIAMHNIEQEYAVVGSWEDTNITLTVLENYIPRFFRGATKLYYSNTDKFHLNKTPHKTDMDPDIEAKLKIQFAFEIEVYNFAKQRLYMQYFALKKYEL